MSNRTLGTPLMALSKCRRGKLSLFTARIIMSNEKFVMNSEKWKNAVYISMLYGQNAEILLLKLAVYTYIYIYIYTHTHTHTHTQLNFSYSCTVHLDTIKAFYLPTDAQ